MIEIEPGQCRFFATEKRGEFHGGEIDVIDFQFQRSLEFFWKNAACEF